MQSNVIVAEAIGHRARFAWLGAALAATIAILVATSVMREPARTPSPSRAERTELFRVHRCGQAAYVDHARIERRARREAERAEQRVRIHAEYDE